MIGSLISSAQEAVSTTQSPNGPTTVETPTPVAPTPVETPTPVEISTEEAPTRTRIIAAEPHEPLNLRFDPVVAPVESKSAFFVDNPVNANGSTVNEAVQARKKAAREAVRQAKQAVKREGELKTAANLTESQNFGQSTTPVDKRGPVMKETRRAKAAALRNAREVGDALRGNINPISGGRNRRNGNRWTHRRPR
jgi:hypothetical protein